MKIALVSRHLNDFAGVPRYVNSLARALARSHEITIFGETFEGLEGAGVAHKSVPWTGSAISSQVVSPLRNEVYDIVHSHHYDYLFASDVMTSHYCEREGLDRMDLGGRDEVYGGPALRSECAAKAAVEMRMLELNRNSPLIVLSRRMKTEFIRHYGVASESIFVIPNGVDLSRYSPDNAARYRDEVRSQLSLAPGSHVVLFMGGDWPRKGLAQAIEALSLPARAGATLLVVGPGDIAAYRNLAKRCRMEDRVIFTGRTREGWKYYAASDIFLLPTQYEAFGLAILEAMASGLPVLVSRDSGAAELIHDGIDGLLINDPTDVAEISAKLGALLRDENLRQQLGGQARRSALHYSWDGMARKTLQVYEGVLQLKQRWLKKASA